MKRFMTTTMAVGLLFAAASCSSDAKPATTTKATTEVTTAASSDVTTGDSTAVSTGAATPGSVDLSGLDAARAQAVTSGIASAAAAGSVLDPACFINIVKQLSDADVKLINDAGPDGQPTLSSSGEALGAQVSTCITPAP
ncbi:MAG: hypothetical protein JWL72_1694 [Ilumatobacteraceae bacterium]|nr:hypothetical protein [Ilumatobacteraceae bacterium]MCU1388356.1 hypothetical protein [Ilumatobacteraceae bacterium]